MANEYDGLVVVDETEWEFEYGSYEMEQETCTPGPGRSESFTVTPPEIKQSISMGTIEWYITSKYKAKTLEFTCRTLVAGSSEVHMELVHYCRKYPYFGESYEKKETKRHVFTRSANSLTISELLLNYNLVTIRILKSRSMFPDFTLESTVVEQLASNVKLRVGDKLFHINKQLLSMHSKYFDRMFNSKFKEANQEEVELKHEPAVPAVFHDFLLLMCVPNAFPNTKNVASLCDFANMFEVDAVRNKCQRHLSMCREMPLEERYMLAGLIGNEELKNSILSEMANLEEAKRIIAAVSKKAFSSC